MPGTQDQTHDQTADPTHTVTPERRLGQRLHAFSNLVSGGYYHRTEKTFGVALAEWRVLRAAILSPRISQGEITSAEGLNVMNVSRAVASLRRKRLLEAQADPADRRRSLVSPTELGLQVGADIAAREHAMYESMFSVLERDELALLDELMGRVNAVLRADELPEPPAAMRPWAQVIANAAEE